MASSVPSLCVQFQNPDIAYLSHAIPEAKRYGADSVQLSHKIIQYSEELWEKEGSVERVKAAASIAKANGLKVEMWTHEISGASAEDIALWKGWPEVDAWLQKKYTRVFATVPEVDGLVLTLAQTQIGIYDKAESNKADLIAIVPSIASESPEQRIAHLITTMSDICRIAGKTLSVRSYVYEPKHLEEFVRAVDSLPSAIRGDVGFMSREYPLDRQPFFPHAPDIGRLPHQTVEFDFGHQFFGQNRVFYAGLGELASHVKFALGHGVERFVVRAERLDGISTFAHPHVINMYALQRLLHTPTISAREVALDSARVLFGIEDRDAASLFADVVERSAEIAKRTLFPRGQWVMQHSQFPSQKYIDSSLRDRKVTAWKQSGPEDELREESLSRPTRTTLDLLKGDLTTARRLLEHSLADLGEIKSSFTDEGKYNQLMGLLEGQQHWLRAFELFQIATFGARYVRDLPATTAPRVIDIIDVLAHLGSLKMLAEHPWLEEYVTHTYPRPKSDGKAHILACCAEIEKLLEKT